MRKILLFSSVAMLVLATAFGSAKNWEQKPAIEGQASVYGAALDDVIDARRNVMLVRAAAEEERRFTGHQVLPR